MKDLGRVNSAQLYNLWRNVAIGLLMLIATIIVSNVLPYYLAPVIALAIAAFLYFYIYNSRLHNTSTCILPVKTILFCIIGYSFVTIIINILHIWNAITLPEEFVFFTHPFIPSLILNPLSFIICTYVYLNRKNSQLCRECRTNRSFGGHRGPASILNHEAHLQLRNFIWVSGVLSVIVWVYYSFFYINVNINGRDSYIFTWLTIIGLIFDEFYFIFRYYNLYLDLKEGNELITPEELKDMTAKTYIRYYLVCGNYIYMTRKGKDPIIENREVIDTPFFTKQTMNGMLGGDVKQTFERMSGLKGGELKFFFGRKSIFDDKHSILRYFYFLDGEPSDYPEIEKEGEWMNFEELKYLYSHNPAKLSELAVFDITRLATIILTEKVFDENGYRKSKIRSYNPGFNLLDVRKSQIDFQDDKWVEISEFNSDTPFYNLKRWWRNNMKKSKKRFR